MSIINKIVGGSIAQPIEAVGRILDNLFTSDEEKLSKEQTLLRLLQRPGLAQIELNKVEAQHRSVFVAGWRPFIGWVCGFALAYHYILRDLIAWGMQAFAIVFPAPPAFDTGELITVLMALLGLGGLRTFEKFTGRAK